MISPKEFTLLPRFRKRVDWPKRAIPAFLLAICHQIQDPPGFGLGFVGWQLSFEPWGDATRGTERAWRGLAPAPGLAVQQRGTAAALPVAQPEEVQTSRRAAPGEAQAAASGLGPGQTGRDPRLYQVQPNPGLERTRRNELGVSFSRLEPQKCWFSFGCCFETNQKRVPKQKKTAPTRVQGCPAGSNSFFGGVQLLFLGGKALTDSGDFSM